MAYLAYQQQRKGTEINLQGTCNHRRTSFKSIVKPIELPSETEATRKLTLALYETGIRHALLFNHIHI